MNTEQVTLIMLKPDCVRKNLEKEILSYILSSLNVHVIARNTVTVNADQILKHCEGFIKKQGTKVEKLIKEMYVGNQVVIYLVKGENALIRVRDLVGYSDPSKAKEHTIRWKFSNDSFERASQEERLVHNLIHCSDSLQAVKEEFNIWFPNGISFENLLIQL